MEKTGRFGNEIVTECLQQTERQCGHAGVRPRQAMPDQTVPRPFCLFTCVREKLEETPAPQGTHVLAFVFVLAGFHCPLCSKFMASDEIEKHLLMCFSKTRLTYNSTILYYLYLQMDT